MTLSLPAGRAKWFLPNPVKQLAQKMMMCVPSLAASPSKPSGVFSTGSQLGPHKGAGPHVGPETDRGSVPFAGESGLETTTNALRASLLRLRHKP
jgi:hypothetical protein